jgi:RNA recognition motif-containing protein
MNQYMISPTLYSPPHANGILGGESTASFYHFPVVWIRGLLFKCQDRDIYSFFAGLDIVDYLRVNKDGRFTGEAYVVFANHMQVKPAAAGLSKYGVLLCGGVRLQKE